MTHPYVQALLPVLLPAFIDLILGLLHRVMREKEKAQPVFNGQYFDLKYFGTDDQSGKSFQSTEAGERSSKPVWMTMQRFLDDDKLSDECWNSEMREVELWENERYAGPIQSLYTDSYPSSSAATQKGWSKQNLRVDERGAWTRSRDGSNVASGSIGHEASGEVRFEVVSCPSPFHL